MRREGVDRRVRLHKSVNRRLARQRGIERDVVRTERRVHDCPPCTRRPPGAALPGLSCNALPRLRVHSVDSRALVRPRASCAIPVALGPRASSAVPVALVPCASSATPIALAPRIFSVRPLPSDQRASSVISLALVPRACSVLRLALAPLAPSTAARLRTRCAPSLSSALAPRRLPGSSVLRVHHLRPVSVSRLASPSLQVARSKIWRPDGRRVARRKRLAGPLGGKHDGLANVGRRGAPGRHERGAQLRAVHLSKHLLASGEVCRSSRGRRRSRRRRARGMPVAAAPRRTTVGAGRGRHRREISLREALLLLRPRADAGARS